jgi:hypothetical protein
MIDEETESWLLQGMEHIYPGKVETFAPGLGSTVVTDGVGILIIHNRENQSLAVAGGVLSGLNYSEDLVRAMGRLNTSAVLGAYVLREGQRDHWSVNYAIKLRYNWLDPRSRANTQLWCDVLGAVPSFVDRGIEEIQPKHGGERASIDEGWWFALMDSF